MWRRKVWVIREWKLRCGWKILENNTGLQVLVAQKKSASESNKLTNLLQSHYFLACGAVEILKYQQSSATGELLCPFLVLSSSNEQKIQVSADLLLEQTKHQSSCHFFSSVQRQFTNAKHSLTICFCLENDVPISHMILLVHLSTWISTICLCTKHNIVSHVTV